MFRGGVDATGSEPSLDGFSGRNCEQVCQNVWDVYLNLNKNRLLLYAHCTMKELGNNETGEYVLAGSKSLMYSSLSDFLFACAGTLSNIILS